MHILQKEKLRIDSVEYTAKFLSFFIYSFKFLSVVLKTQHQIIRRLVHNEVG